MRRFRVIALLTAIALLLSGCSLFQAKSDYSWTSNRTIVHALGLVDGVEYTNSKEAFENSLANGQTVFEVDLSLSGDGELICIHDWSLIDSSYSGADEELELYRNMTKDEFLARKIRDKYTPLCMEDLILVMKENPSIYFVTDTKEDQEEGIKKQFNNLIEICKRNKCPEVLKRIIPQIYNDEMFFTLKEIYPWKSYIYTSYYTFPDAWDEDKFVDFAHENGIGALAVLASRATPHLLEKANALDIKVYVHTYNTEEEREAFFARGVWGLYTDSLPPVKN